MTMIAPEAAIGKGDSDSCPGRVQRVALGTSGTRHRSRLARDRHSKCASRASKPDLRWTQRKKYEASNHVDRGAAALGPGSSQRRLRRRCSSGTRGTHELFNGIMKLTNSSQPGVKLEWEFAIVASGPGLPTKAGSLSPQPRSSRWSGLLRHQVSEIRYQGTQTPTGICLIPDT